MISYKKIASLFVLSFAIFSPITSFALSAKDSVVSSIDSLNTSIIGTIADREKTLANSAADLGNKYDTAIRALGFTSDEIEALTSIKKLNVPSFRQEVAQAYGTLKISMFQDIKKTQASLSALRDEVSLKYTDLSPAQKQIYDDKIASFQKEFTSFSGASILGQANFNTTLSLRIAPSVDLVSKMMRENSDYIRFIRDIRTEYAKIQTKKAYVLARKDVFDRDILPKIQGGFVVFTANKKIFTDAIRNDLVSGLEKALLQPRLKSREKELRAYVDSQMTKWNESINKSFSQDNDLVYVSRDVANMLATDKNLTARMYDDAGNIRDIDRSGSLLSDMMTFDASIQSASLDGLIATYSTGNVLSSLLDGLNTSYRTNLLLYRNDLTKLLQDTLNTVSLEEKTHTQTLGLIDQEERILRQNLESVTSVEFANSLVQDFIKKINVLAQVDALNDNSRKIRALTYKYSRVVTQRNIEDASLSFYYAKRPTLDASLTRIFSSLEGQGKDVAIKRLTSVLTRIDTLFATKNFSPKNKYTLLVVQSNILKYLEDANK